MTNEHRKLSPESSYALTALTEPTSSFANTWTKLSECDEFIGPKRSKHTMITYGNSLYVFGGDNGKHMINDLVTYDCTNNSWSRALNSSPPTPRYHHTTVVYNSSMFLFGGYTADQINSLCNKNDLYEYRFGTGTWHLWNTDNNPVPPPRAAHGSVCYDNKLWIFAGYGNNRLNDMWYISLNTPPQQPKVWKEVEQKGDQPPTVCNFTLAVVQDAMYLFSGQSGAKTSNYLFKFDFKTSVWSKVSSNYILRSTSSPPERRSGHVMVAHNNCLYIYGGVLGNNFFHDLYVFDLDTKTWSLIKISPNTPLPNSRSFMAASVHGESLYIFGGNLDQNTRSSELYRFKLPTQPKCTLRDDFYKLLEKELFCDLHFSVENEVIKAHCAIVACRSVYFRQRIKTAYEKLRQTSCITSNSDLKIPFNLCANNIIELKITDISSPNSFKIILEFLYTDRIVSIEGKEQKLEYLKLMADVYKLAEQYSLGKLVHVCENFFESTISCQNVLNILQYVDKLSLNYLKECCIKFLIKESNFNQIVMSNEFEHLQQALMVEIIRRYQTYKTTLASADHTYSTIELLPQIEKCPSLEDDFENFFTTGIGNEFSDIIIYLNESKTKYFYSHKCILASRCSYYEAYFRSFMPKEHYIMMRIGDTMPTYDVCMSLLKYVYYGHILMSPQDALCLLSASHYFQFTNLRLQVFCKQNLEANVSKDNVFDILEVANSIQANDMKQFALKIIRNNYVELARSENIKKLSKDLLLDIIVDVSCLFDKNANTNPNGNSKNTGATSPNMSSNNSHSTSSSLNNSGGNSTTNTLTSAGSGGSTSTLTNSMSTHLSSLPSFTNSSN